MEAPMNVKKTSLSGDADQHGKLWIKLKLPKEEEDGVLEDDDQHKKTKKKKDEDDVIFARICQVCNKGFKSGKALGGHMRVHFQTHKDLSFSRKQKNPATFKNSPEKRSDFFLGENKINPRNTCSECGKNFPSPKSLFGHMRCHPDRDWRGVRPPFPGGFISFSHSSSVVSDDGGGGGGNEAVESGSGADLDLASSLGSWSVTAKRGRKSLLNDEDDDEKKMQAAVLHLMSLADGDWDSKKSSKEIDAHDGDFSAGNHDVYHDSSDDSEKTHDDQDQNQLNLMKKGKRRVKKKKLRDLDHHDIQKFRCTTCDRSFPTHQALGGHRSSHKFRMLLQAEDEDDEEIVGIIRDENQENSTDENQEGIGSNNSNYSHVCKICNKNFPTGQALGGHKRCHRINNGINEAISQSGSGRILEFDLNEEPPMEFDQSADDQNVASCSYNSVEYHSLQGS